MNNNCTLCIALWRDYAAATHADIAIESKLEIARLRHDQNVIQRLSPEAQAASSRRIETRRAVEEHERLSHSHENDSAAEA